MKKIIIFVGVCLAVFFHSNTAFAGAIDQLESISGGGSGNRSDVGPPGRMGTKPTCKVSVSSHLK